MYKKLVLSICLLAFFAVVLSAYARLSDAGLGCANWPACYEENAQKERYPMQGAARGHGSWQWKLHSQVVQLLGILAIAVCALSWRKRRESGQSPLLPTLLLGLMVFLAIFGILAFNHLSRPVIVLVHLAGGMAMLALTVWISLGQIEQAHTISTSAPQKNWPTYSWVGIILVLAQTMEGGWMSSNFAALACTDFPLCKGALLPPMDFSITPDGFISAERLTAIHWMHRTGALLTALYLSWLSVRVMAMEGLRHTGVAILGLVLLQSAVGIFNVLAGLPLAGAVMHNAVAMLLLATLVMLSFRLKNGPPAKER